MGLVGGPYCSIAQCVQKISTGQASTYLLKNDQSIWFWGSNLIDNVNPNPTILRSGNYQNVIAGDAVIFIQDVQGNLFAKGDNNYGSFGNGNTNTYTDFVALGNFSGLKSLTAGLEFGAMIKADGSLWTWGKNNRYQVGDGTTTPRLSPVRIGTDTDWKALYSTSDGSLIAQKNNGQLWGWGFNGSQVVGSFQVVGNYVMQPRLLNTDADWTTVACGGAHVVTLKANHSLWSWGANGHWQLGRGTDNFSKWLPEQIGTDTDWKAIAAGYSTSYAIKNNGTLWGFGHNDVGQMGTATGQDVQVPTQIGTDTDWEQVHAGFDFAVAVKSNGSIYTWGGYNSLGELGNGTVGVYIDGPFYPNTFAVNVPGCPYFDNPSFALNEFIQAENPFTDSLHLRYGALAQAEVWVYNNTGQRLGQYSLLPSGGTLQIPTESWPQGLYLAQLLQNGQAVGSLKVVKK
jgi:alpha-tubulin suppressor-like RCC1 family protein